MNYYFNSSLIKESVRSIVWNLILKKSLARKCLAYFPVKEGEVGRLGRKKPYIFPCNITISSNINNLVINDINIKCLSQLIDCSLAPLDIIYQEEKIFKNLLDSMVDQNKNLIKYKNFNFDTFLTLISYINKPDKCLMSYSLWDDFSNTNTEFSKYFNPTPKYDQVMEGYMGDLLGISIYTDIFKEKRILKNNEVYMLPTSIKLGGITQTSTLKVDLIQEDNLIQEDTNNLSCKDYSDKNYSFNLYCIEGLGIISDQVIKAVKAV